MRKLAAVVLSLFLLSLCGCRLGFQPAETVETANWDAASFDGTTAPEETEAAVETEPADPFEKYKTHYSETMGDISASTYISPADKLNFRIDFEGVRRSKILGQNESFYQMIVANAESFGDRIDEYIGWIDGMGYCPLFSVTLDTGMLNFNYTKDAEEGENFRGNMGGVSIPATFEEFTNNNKDIAKQYVEQLGEDYVADEPEFYESNGDYDLMYFSYKTTDTKANRSYYIFQGGFKNDSGTVSFEGGAESEKELEKLEKWLLTLKKA